MPTIEQLREMQSMSLDEKVLLTQRRIEEFYYKTRGQCYISFSGGKDSTVLMHIARDMFPDIPAVFVNTGLEYPEIRQFALSFDNVKELRPMWGRRSRNHKPTDVMGFMDVVSLYGYPLISKDVSRSIKDARSNKNSHAYRKMTGTISLDMRNGKSRFDHSAYKPIIGLPVRISNMCCDVMKKSPAKNYGDEIKRFPMVATMACEGINREAGWTRFGCNVFDGKNPMSRPMSFWLEQDVLRYIVENNIPICSVYGDVCVQDYDGNLYTPSSVCSGKLVCSGCSRTGCMFCAFGAHLEKGETRFQRLKRTHPKIYEYCIGGGTWAANDKYDPSKTEPDDWNPKQIWVPSKEGLGMGKVFDMINEIYGKDFLRYE